MSLDDPKNKKLLDDFVAEYAPLINKHASILRSKGMIPTGTEVEDLHAAGYDGLIEALHKYDHTAAMNVGFKEGENPFAKYAETHIRGKMLNHLAAQDKIPRAIRVKAKNLEAASKVPPVKKDEEP